MTSYPPEPGRENGEPPSAEQLSAYHDGEASPELRDEIENWLAIHPEASETLQEWRSFDEALRIRLDPIVLEPPPASLTGRVRTWSSVPGVRVAAAAALLLMFASAGWVARGSLAPVGFPTEALRAHAVYAVEKRYPIEVEASQTAHLESWLTKRIGVPIVAPSLAGQGYRLMGGRLLSSSAGPAALLMYEDENANRVSLIVARLGEEGLGAAGTVRNEANAGMFWREGDAIYAVVGASDNAFLSALGDAVAAQSNGI